MANPLTWVDSSGDNSWETASNWSDAYAAPHVPGSNDVIYVNGQHAGDLITLNATQTQNNLIFQSNGNGYTVGLAASTAGLYFNYNTGIFIEGSLTGSGNGETINAPIESPGNLFLSNFSPATAEPTVPGMNGSNNTLTIAGTLQVDNSNNLVIEGDGNTNITGSINGTTHFYQDSSATTTLSGTNNFSGWVIVAGTLVLDNTVNNTDKLSEGVLNKDPALVLGQNNSGGHLVINGNEAGTVETLGGQNSSGSTYNGHLDIRGGTNSVVLNGSTDGGGATVLNMGSFADNFNTTIDLTANGNAAFYTTTTNNGQYGAQINILGQNVTYDKTYWAQAGTGYAGQGTAGYGVNAQETLITPLINDNGDAFNSQWSNYTVDAGGQTLNSGYYTALGPQYNENTIEGADTIRFAAAGTLDLGKGTTYTDPNSGITTIGNGNLYMVYGGIMVTKDVTGNTAIVNGTLFNGRDLYGMTFLNYGTGTLTIGASLADSVGTYQSGNDRTDSFSFGGGGKIVLSGDNSTIAPGSTIVVNSGVLQITSNNALGIDNHINMGDVTSVLDLNGNSVHISALTSDGNFAPGNQAAAAGLNTSVKNSAAGTISRLTIEGYSQPQSSNSDGNVGINYVDNDVNLGTYYGGLNEVSGSIISLDIEKGGATSQVQFNMGTSDPYGDPNLANVVDPSGIQGPATQITGAVIVGAGANLAFVNYGNVETLGATVLNGNMGAAGQQAADYATTYLTGTGAIVSGNGYRDFDLNTVGSATDTFAGKFGSSTVGASMGLYLSGTGTVSLPSGIFANINTEGMSSLITTGQGAGGFFAGGLSNVTMTGNSGTILGSNGPIDLYGGTLHISPSGSGADVVVAGGESGFQPGGSGTMILDRGGNNSLTLDLGNTGTGFYFNNNNQNSLTIGSVQGIAALGSIDRVVGLSNAGGAISITYVRTAAPNTVIQESAYAQDDSVGGTQAATFLTYNGTGASTDAGFMAYQYSASQIDNLSGAGDGSNEKIDENYTMTGGAYGLYTLEVDNGATLNTNGLLDIGWEDGTGSGGLILNGATISGGVGFGRYLAVYTSAANGWVDSLNAGYGGQDLAKNGPGTLFVGRLGTGVGRVLINQGALDLGGSVAGHGPIIIDGGTLEINGTVNMALNNAAGGVVLEQGGFAARGAPLYLTLYDSGGGSTLTWGVGGTANFLGEGAVLSFGAPTANNEVFFGSNLNLGLQYGGVNGQDQLYSRVINVTAGTADTGDRMLYQDDVVMTGSISASNPYVGLSKTGTGTLVMYNENTYKGATMIAQGELVVLDDGGLGTAPTAAYALNTAPGVNGAALTPGAIEINGGAALGTGIEGSDMVLNSNRQILLASGTTGATPGIIDVAGSTETGPYGAYTTLSFGGVIADYVGEVGSLQKQGNGTFNYSGTSANTGSFSVTDGTLLVSGAGSINSGSGVTINNSSSDANATAQFNYASTVGLTRAVTFGAGGGVFAYNSTAAYTGSTSLTLGSHQTVGGAGNLSLTAVSVGSGATITPGNVSGQAGTATTGALTTGALTLLSGGNYNFLIADVTGAAGVGYSTINASSVDLSGLTAPFAINLETLAGNVPGAPANFNSGLDYDFVLISTGLVDGITPETESMLNAEMFVHAEANNGATGFDPAPDHWYVYESADSSTLYLHYSAAAVPEPGTWALLLGGLGFLGLLPRFRRQVL